MLALEQLYDYFIVNELALNCYHAFLVSLHLSLYSLQQTCLTGILMFGAVSSLEAFNFVEKTGFPAHAEEKKVAGSSPSLCFVSSLHFNPKLRVSHPLCACLGPAGSTCLDVPAGYAGISRWRHNHDNMPVVVCRAGFLFVCRAFPPACQFNSSVVPGALSRTHVYAKIARPEFTQTLTVMIFCWSSDFVQRLSYYLQTHIYVSKTRSVARLSEIVARLTATTAISSRMCR